MIRNCVCKKIWVAIKFTNGYLEETVMNDIYFWDLKLMDQH